MLPVALSAAYVAVVRLAVTAQCSGEATAILRRSERPCRQVSGPFRLAAAKGGGCEKTGPVVPVVPLTLPYLTLPSCTSYAIAKKKKKVR